MSPCAAAQRRCRCLPGATLQALPGCCHYHRRWTSPAAALTYLSLMVSSHSILAFLTSAHSLPFCVSVLHPYLPSGHSFITMSLLFMDSPPLFPFLFFLILGANATVSQRCTGEAQLGEARIEVHKQTQK